MILSSMVFARHRFETTPMILLLQIAFSLTFSGLIPAAEAASMALRVEYARTGRTLTVFSNPSEPVAGCSMELYGSSSRAGLLTLEPVELVLSDPSDVPGPRMYQAKRLPLLSRSPRGTAAYLRSRLLCGGTESLSTISKVNLKKTTRGASGSKQWLTHLKSKIAVPTLTLVDAFPNLIFETPIDLQDPGDGSGRLFVAEQSGKIFSFQNKKTVASKSLVLDLSSKLVSGGERGLLGITFHPNFEKNGYLFVHYSKAGSGDTVVARYKVLKSEADPQSEMVILEQAQPFANHNGGQLAFGRDGYLYIALGDGGGAGDPQENGQNRSTLLGKILRIDINKKSKGRNYSIPSDNPFRGNNEGAREEIYAYGLRNPWRISFDRKNGKLWAADVGQNALEEVDIIQAGGNYGWNIMEGSRCYDAASCDQSGLIPPLAQYGRSFGQSITGGIVYRGSSVPALYGIYIFGDFVSGRIWSLDGSGNSSAITELFDTELNISSFGSDEDGNLYLLSYSDGKIMIIR